MRNLKGLGYRLPLNIVNKAHQANQLYPNAISMIDSVRMYEQTCKKVDDRERVCTENIVSSTLHLTGTFKFCLWQVSCLSMIAFIIDIQEANIVNNNSAKWTILSQVTKLNSCFFLKSIGISLESYPWVIASLFMDCLEKRIKC